MKQVYYWRRLAMALAIIMVLSNVSHSHAMNSRYGIVNPDFHWNKQCSLYAWTTSGVVEAQMVRLTSSSSCMARLKAVNDLRSSAGQQVVSKLEQQFWLPPETPFINFAYATPGSAAGFTLRVHNESGSVIHQENISVPAKTPLTWIKRDLAAYGGQVLTLSIQSQVINPQPGILNEQYLFIDFYAKPSTGDGSDPNLPPDGGI